VKKKRGEKVGRVKANPRPPRKGGDESVSQGGKYSTTGKKKFHPCRKRAKKNIPMKKGKKKREKKTRGIEGASPSEGKFQFLVFRNARKPKKHR